MRTHLSRAVTHAHTPEQGRHTCACVKVAEKDAENLEPLHHGFHWAQMWHGEWGVRCEAMGAMQGWAPPVVDRKVMSSHRVSDRIALVDRYHLKSWCTTQGLAQV